MFGRKKKSKEVVGTPCPFCDFMNDLGANQCSQCYYEFDKSARDQPMAPPTTSNNDIMALLLNDNEEEEEEEPMMVEAVLAVDDVTVEVDQYAAAEVPVENGEETSVGTFDYIESASPALATTVVSRPEDEVEVELTSKDAPKATTEFELPDVNPLDEVSEPVHTGQGGLFTPEDQTVDSNDDLSGSVGPDPHQGTELPELPEDDEDLEETPSLASAVALEETEEMSLPDVPDVPDVPDWPDEELLATVDTALEAPDIPDLPEETAMFTTPSLPDDLNDGTSKTTLTGSPALPELPEDSEEPAVIEASPSLTPALPDDTPDLPDMDGPAQTTTPEQEAETNLRMWPWPAGEPWSNQQVYQAVIAAMEHLKHGRLPTAAEALDGLGPHLDHHLDMLPHIVAIMVHIGRKEHAEWTIQMASHLFGDDPHIEQARAQVPE